MTDTPKTDGLSKLKTAYPGVPVLDENQKTELKGAFEAVVARARGEELPKSRWENYQETKTDRDTKKDPRQPGDYITSTHEWFEKHGDAGIQGLSTAQFARAHEALRSQEGVAEILYGAQGQKLYDSDLFFALKQLYVQLQYPSPRR